MFESYIGFSWGVTSNKLFIGLYSFAKERDTF